MKIDALVGVLLKSGAHRATHYISAKQIMRVTRRIERWKGRRGFNKRDHEITLTIGRPNAREQKFIKACQKAGEPFPVKKPQLQFLKA